MEKLGNTSDWLGFSIGTSDGIIESVEDEIASLVENKLLSETPTIIMQIGRKAVHLLKDFTGELPEAGFPLSFCRVLYSGNLIFTDEMIQEGSKVIIFIDTIHTGREMNIVLRQCIKNNLIVNKIYCYLKNVDGVKAIKYLEELNIKDIISTHESRSEPNYSILESPLKIFYRSRITPMDLDISYNEYTITDNLNVKKLNNLFKNLLVDIFHIEINDVSVTENIITTTVSELQYDIDKLDEFKKLLNKIFIINNNYLISSISIRVKILNRERRDNFVVSILIDTDIDVNICNERGSNIYIPICLMEDIETSIEEEKVRKVICPHCVNTHISNHILNEINDIMPRYNMTEASELKIRKSYRPPDYQNLLELLRGD